MIYRSWPPGSADVHVGPHFAARLRVLLSGAWRPRTRSEVRCGWGLAVWLRTLSLLMGEVGLAGVMCAWCFD